MKLFFPGRPPRTADRTEINYLLIRTRSLRNALAQLRKESLPPHLAGYDNAIRSLNHILGDLEFLEAQLVP